MVSRRRSSTPKELRSGICRLPVRMIHGQLTLSLTRVVFFHDICTVFALHGLHSRYIVDGVFWATPWPKMNTQLHPSHAGVNRHFSLKNTAKELKNPKFGSYESSRTFSIEYISTEMWREAERTAGQACGIVGPSFVRFTPKNAMPHRNEKTLGITSETKGFCKRGRRGSNPQPPDRQSGALTN